MDFLKHMLSYMKPPITGFWLGPRSPWYLWVLGIIGDFLICGAITFYVLQLVPRRHRKVFIAVITFLAGLVYALEYFIPAAPKTDMNFMTKITDHLDAATTVVQSFAVGLGVYSLMHFHGKNIARRRGAWGNSVAFFIAFFAMMLAGFWKEYGASKWATGVFDTLFQGSIVALGSTMFSVIGFYIVSAAYRAFRIRSKEATVMLVAAFIVMLGQVSVGAAITSSIPLGSIWSSFRLENLSLWILNQPNAAAQRGISFGIEIGLLAMALRTWLSLERGSFYDSEL